MPTVKAGQALTFYNTDQDLNPNQVWHTITSCKAPCDKATGIAYPLADSDIQFDSGELGTSGRSDRRTPGLDDPEESPDGHVYVLLSNPPLDARRVPRDRLTPPRH